MNATECDYYTIEAIELMPQASQRELAKCMGMALGKVNYCLKELAQKGWITNQKVRRSNGKWANAYQLTPTGYAEKAGLVEQFLMFKKVELEKLQAEIHRAEQALHSQWVWSSVSKQ